MPTRISKALSHWRPRQAPDSSRVSRSEVSTLPAATSYQLPSVSGGCTPAMTATLAACRLTSASVASHCSAILLLSTLIVAIATSSLASGFYNKSILIMLLAFCYGGRFPEAVTKGVKVISGCLMWEDPRSSNCVQYICSINCERKYALKDSGHMNKQQLTWTQAFAT